MLGIWDYIENKIEVRTNTHLPRPPTLGAGMSPSPEPGPGAGRRLPLPTCRRRSPVRGAGGEGTEDIPSKGTSKQSCEVLQNSNLFVNHFGKLSKCVANKCVCSETPRLWRVVGAELPGASELVSQSKTPALPCEWGEWGAGWGRVGRPGCHTAVAKVGSVCCGPLPHLPPTLRLSS